MAEIVIVEFKGACEGCWSIVNEKESMKKANMDEERVLWAKACFNVVRLVWEVGGGVQVGILG